MWIKSYSKTYQGVTAQNIWNTWIDTSNWHIWDHDIEYCKFNGPFIAGADFIIKPKGMSEVKMKLIDAKPLQSYTDSCTFFGAQLYGIHLVEETAQGITLTITIKMTGFLKYLWIKLVAQNIVNELPTQMDALVTQARLKHD